MWLVTLVGWFSRKEIKCMNNSKTTNVHVTASRPVDVFSLLLCLSCIFVPLPCPSFLSRMHHYLSFVLPRKEWRQEVLRASARVSLVFPHLASFWLGCRHETCTVAETCTCESDRSFAKGIGEPSSASYYMTSTRPFVYITHYTRARPTCTRECLHRVWSRNGGEGCFDMPHAALCNVCDLFIEQLTASSLSWRFFLAALRCCW